jgi:hypothetical protein
MHDADMSTQHCSLSPLPNTWLHNCVAATTQPVANVVRKLNMPCSLAVTVSTAGRQVLVTVYSAPGTIPPKLTAFSVAVASTPVLSNSDRAHVRSRDVAVGVEDKRPKLQAPHVPNCTKLHSVKTNAMAKTKLGTIDHRAPTFHALISQTVTGIPPAVRVS